MRCASFLERVLAVAVAATLLAITAFAAGSPARSPPQLHNPFAYIPAPCWTKTRDDGGRVVNPCYVCHNRSRPPNFTNDAELQLTLSLPSAVADNPWRNLFAPPVAPPITDQALLAYVRTDNYFAPDGTIALARTLDALPPSWDTEGDGHWDGYRPDAYYHFDGHGFD